MEKYQIMDATSQMQSQIIALFKRIFDQMELPQLKKLNNDEQEKLLNEAFNIVKLRQWAVIKVILTQSDKVVGVAYSYNGVNENKLKELLLERTAPIDLHPDVETKSGEWYLEMLVIDQAYQGQGLGKKLLEDVWQIAQQNKLSLTLNVDHTNIKAKKLYQAQGFIDVSSIMIGQHRYFHMQKNKKIATNV